MSKVTALAIGSLAPLACFFQSFVICDSIPNQLADLIFAYAEPDGDSADERVLQHFVLDQ